MFLKKNNNNNGVIKWTCSLLNAWVNCIWISWFNMFWKSLVPQPQYTICVTICHMISCGWWNGDVETPFHQPQLTIWRVMVQIVHFFVTLDFLVCFYQLMHHADYKESFFNMETTWILPKNWKKKKTTRKLWLLYHAYMLKVKIINFFFLNPCIDAREIFRHIQ